MKLKLTVKKIPSDNKMFPTHTVITHAKLMEDDGKFIKFVKHDGEFLSIINNVEIQL